jgi:hypothetical protein
VVLESAVSTLQDYLLVNRAMGAGLLRVRAFVRNKPSGKPHHPSPTLSISGALSEGTTEQKSFMVGSLPRLARFHLYIVVIAGTGLAVRICMVIEFLCLFPCKDCRCVRRSCRAGRRTSICPIIRVNRVLSSMLVIDGILLATRLCRGQARVTHVIASSVKVKRRSGFVT